MAGSNTNSPMLGYNTNVRHEGKLFHIQTEDSGVGHPHVITHLFVEGTILATKKTSYEDYLERETWEDEVRQLMKEQHKTMFIELRDGAHDAVAAKLLGIESVSDPPSPERPISEPPKRYSEAPTVEIDDAGVRVIAPASVQANSRASRETAEELAQASSNSVSRSIFDSPDDDGEFGDSLITDKSLDEVILSYLTDELDE
jgi:hypothetical protein